MHTKISISAKDIFRNQHRLIRFIEQSLRLCSTQSLKTAAQTKVQTDADYQVISPIPAQFASAHTAPTEIIHEADVGQQFSHAQLSVRLARPDQLNAKPDKDEDLEFGKIFTDHMLKIPYHRSLGGWQKPEITPMEPIVLHPAAKVLHYAVELFEGMKAYRGIDGKIRMFRPDMNMHRMNLSAQRCGLPTFDGKELIKCLNRLISIDSEWVPHKESASLYIRPTLIGIDPSLGVATSNSALLYSILCPSGGYFKSNSKEGISLLADPSFTRAWHGGVGDRKMGSNYAPTIHVQKTAHNLGLHQALWLHGPEQQVTEAGTMNVFMVYINDQGKKEIITAPLNGLILPGITRDSVLTFVRQWGNLKVSEAPFTMSQLCKLLQEGRVLEFFGTGTACVVSPVSHIYYMGEKLYIPTMEQEKPVFDLLRNTLMDIQYGKVEHPWAQVIDV